MAQLTKEKKALEKKLGRKIDTWYSPGALRGKYGADWYPGLELDVMQGKVFDAPSARLAKEQRAAGNIPPTDPLDRPLTGKEKAFGTRDAMKMMLEGTPEQRAYRKQMLGFLAGPEGQPGYIENALQALQQQAQPSPLEQQLMQQSLLGPMLQQQLMGALSGNVRYPSEAAMMPSPYSPQMQMGLPSGYTPQGSQPSDFSYLMSAYGPQAGAALGEWMKSGGPQQVANFAQQRLPGVLSSLKNLGSQGLEQTARAAALPIWAARQGLEGMYGGAQQLGSGIWNALSGLMNR